MRLLILVATGDNGYENCYFAKMSDSQGCVVSPLKIAIKP